MKKIIVCTYILVCIHAIGICQNFGDFRTCISGYTNWDNRAVWEQFDGTNWIPASVYPGESSIVNTVNICNNSTITCNKNIVDYPLQNLMVDHTSTLIIDNKNILIQNNFTLLGTLSIQSNTGIFVCNTASLQGTIIQDYSKTIRTHSHAYIRGIEFVGTGTTRFDVQGNMYIENKPSVFTQISLEIYGKTHIQSDIEFSSTAGDKLFHDTVFVSNCTWTNTVGETFTCNSSLVIQNATIVNKAFPIFSIAQNAILNSAIFARDNDFFGTYVIQGNIEIPTLSNTIIESACIELQGNCNISGTLALNDKKGVKTIYDSFVINEGGVFQNNGNDRLLIYGNLENNGTCNNGTNGVFQLLGNNKLIQGIISIPRLIIDGTYTNMHYLEVKTTFTGSGTLTQNTNAELKIQSPSSPTIIANAIGNVVWYTRSGKQDIQCNNFYILKAANNKNILAIQQNTNIIHQLIFTKQCFIDCNGYQISLNAWHDSVIVGTSNYDCGFLLQSGSVHLQQLPFEHEIILPTFTLASIEGYAGIGIEQRDVENSSVTIHAVQSQVVEFPSVPHSNTIQSGIVGNTYSIESTSTRAKLTLFWHSSAELPAFERTHCHIMHYNGSNWHQLHDSESAQIHATNIYSMSGETSDFSPFTISSNSEFLAVDEMNVIISKTTMGTKLQWESNHTQNISHFSIFVSEDGTHFNKIADIPYSKDERLYEYIDNSTYSSHIIYYTLQSNSSNGSSVEYPIQSIINDDLFPHIHIYKNERNLKIQHNTNSTFSIYTIQNTLILQAYCNQTISYAHIPRGIYIVEIENKRFKIVLE